MITPSTVTPEPGLTPGGGAGSNRKNGWSATVSTSKLSSYFWYTRVLVADPATLVMTGPEAARVMTRRAVLTAPAESVAVRRISFAPGLSATAAALHATLAAGRIGRIPAASVLMLSQMTDVTVRPAGADAEPLSVTVAADVPGGAIRGRLRDGDGRRQTGWLCGRARGHASARPATARLFSARIAAIRGTRALPSRMSSWPGPRYLRAR